jgi:hypothetical protein
MEDLVAGQTSPVEQQLLRDGAPFNATGMTLTLILRDSADVVLTLAGAVVWSDATTSKARFTPAANDLIASNAAYRARWRVVQGSVVSYYPSAGADPWWVRR